MTERPGVTVRPATDADVLFLSTCLRADDEMECELASGMTPLEALGQGLADSEVCHVATYKGEPVAIFGIVAPEVPDSDPPRVASVWMLGSDRMAKLGVTICRLAPEWLRRVGAKYDVLTCLAWAGNMLHLKWLGAMGFHIIRSLPHGPKRRLFVEMAYIKDSFNV